MVVVPVNHFVLLWHVWQETLLLLAFCLWCFWIFWISFFRRRKLWLCLFTNFAGTLFIFVVLYFLNVFVQILQQILELHQILVEISLIFRWYFFLHENISFVIWLGYVLRRRLLFFLMLCWLWLLLLLISSARWPLPFGRLDCLWILLAQNWGSVWYDLRLLNLLVLVFIFHKVLPVFLHLISHRAVLLLHLRTHWMILSVTGVFVRICFLMKLWFCLRSYISTVISWLRLLTWLILVVKIIDCISVSEIWQLFFGLNLICWGFILVSSFLLTRSLFSPSHNLLVFKELFSGKLLKLLFLSFLLLLLFIYFLHFLWFFDILILVSLPIHNLSVLSSQSFDLILLFGLLLKILGHFPVFFIFLLHFFLLFLFSSLLL